MRYGSSFCTTCDRQVRTQALQFTKPQSWIAIVIHLIIALLTAGGWLLGWWFIYEMFYKYEAFVCMSCGQKVSDD